MTHGIAKYKDRDGESGNGGGVVVEFLVHESNAGGEHRRRQRAGSALDKVPTNQPVKLNSGGGACELPDERDATDKEQSCPFQPLREIPA